ncbi:hypothetical protein DM860_010990 [Cuscuta australis]|uniref:Rab-GAP TBC domain-containing protein n=1 Tax=Cuscuta australis TaxID=267555 RepID=A0A328E471_9ASTE|nr:hypothetical protein DM860_010990 [Cuscuta australis]
MKSLKRSQTPSNSSLPSSSSSSSTPTSWVQLRSVLFVVASSSPAACSSSDGSSSRGHHKSPWSRRKRKRILSPQQWKSFFTADGRLRAGGVKFLKKVRSGGVDPSIRAEVWPFLLGVYDLNSSKEERDHERSQKRKEYEKLRRQCRRLSKSTDEKEADGSGSREGMESPDSEDAVSARESLSSNEYSDGGPADDVLLFDGNVIASKRMTELNYASESESSDSDSSSDPEASLLTLTSTSSSKEEYSPVATEEVQSKLRNPEDFATWQRIIRLDAIRSNAEWMAQSLGRDGAEFPDDRARRSAEAVGLKDYDHLDPTRIFHAARLVAILEAYALYDPEIGYCQGMSDLLSPILSVIAEDFEAFWCFVGFMKKARHNFRLDEVGIRRQLSIVSKIIKHKDSHLYRHLVKLQAEDCFFVYRMVIVLFRRELTFDQTVCLWEVMWADQAAIRAGIGKSAWSRMRLRAPPTEDLLLYAIAASVLQRRKQIIEKYSSMDEILRECNNMAGHLDVWKLLDDAHDLVVTLHDKV